MSEETTVVNGNPYDLVDKENKNTTNESSNGKLSFFEKLIQKIAKMSGLPDPKTGNNTTQPTENNNEQNNTTTENQKTIDINTTLDQDILTQEEQKKQEEEKKKFSFENVMSGVSGVLDKIEKKIGEKTGIDFDAPLKKREEKLNKEFEENKIEESTAETTNESTNKPTIKNEIEKNNEEYLSQNH